MPASQYPCLVNSAPHGKAKLDMQRLATGTTERPMRTEGNLRRACSSAGELLLLAAVSTVSTYDGHAA